MYTASPRAAAEAITIASTVVAPRTRAIREADLYHVLRALTYFDDAEKDPVLPRGMDAAKWEAIKLFFRKQAPELVSEAHG